jgi:hypothetical protein
MKQLFLLMAPLCVLFGCGSGSESRGRSNRIDSEAVTKVQVDTVSNPVQLDTSNVGRPSPGKYLSCDSLLSVLVMTSSLDRDKKNGFNVKVDEVVDGVLKLKIVNTNEYKMDVPIGWIDFDMKRASLKDVSPDHDSAINLTYDRSIFNLIRKNCQVIE